MEAAIFVGIILIVVAVVVVCVKLQNRIELKRLKEQKQRETEAYVASLVDQAQREIEKVNDVKSVTAKERGLDRVIALLDELSIYEESRQYIPNLGDDLNRIQATRKVLRIVEKVERADKNRFKGSKKAEMNALAEALYDIEVAGLTSQDFLDAKTAVSGTGEIPTVESIEARLTELGWQRSAS